MKVIGLMSGTSLDGLDIAFCDFSLHATHWHFTIEQAQTVAYSDDWYQRLATLPAQDAVTFAATDHALGRLFGQAVRDFCVQYQLKPDLVASHGHTIFHQPHLGFTAQIGNGAAISAACGLPVACDFRSGDVALGGQGAPLVPIGDKLLFPAYAFCLNLGGIANISYDDTTGRRVAFDICPVNMVLNALAGQVGQAYDENGQLARSGSVNQSLLMQLNQLDFYQQPYPKSLGKEWVDAFIFPLLSQSNLSVADQLATCCEHIAIQLAQVLAKSMRKGKVLVTGGGAFNTYLIEKIAQILPEGTILEVPNSKLVQFKEALIFAFLGLLRVRQEANCLKAVTGAAYDHVGGAVYQVQQPS